MVLQPPANNLPTLTVTANGDGEGGLHCPDPVAHPAVLLPEDLRAALYAWSQLLDRQRRSGPPWSSDDWDWLNFHAQGLALAVRVKRAVGPGARVLYAKPECDPNHRLQRVTELRAADDLVVLPDVGPLVLPWCTQLVSGGQTGADRAALDFAIHHGCPHGGWVPVDRLAEDGRIPLRYQLTELAQGGYRQRMRRNVIDTDATLVFNLGVLDGGTWATADMARRQGRPSRVVALDDGVADTQVSAALEWLQQRPPGRLNIAGPREGKRPGVYALTLQFLEAMRSLGQHPGDGGIPGASGMVDSPHSG